MTPMSGSISYENLSEAVEVAEAEFESVSVSGDAAKVTNSEATGLSLPSRTVGFK